MTSNRKRFFGYISRNKKFILSGILFTLLMGIVQIMTGTLLKLISDSVEKFIKSDSASVPIKLSLPFLKQKIVVFQTLLEGKEDIFWGLLYVGLAYLIFSFFELLFEYFREVYMNAGAQKILQNFKSDIYGKLLRLPYRYFYKHKTGDLISRVTYDVTTMTDIINLFIELTRSFVYLIVLLPVMFFISWKVTLIVIVFFPLSFILINAMIRKIEIVSKGITDNVGDYTAFLDEKINNFRLVKIFGQEEKEQKKFENLIEENYKLNLKNIKLISFLKPSNQFLGVMGLCLVFLYFNYTMVFEGTKIGNAVFYLYILSQAFKPIKKLAREVGRLQIAAVSIKKIFRFLDSEEETDNNLSGNGNPGNIDSIEYKDATYSYDSEKDAIRNVNLKINKGEAVSVTGKSGSGKTTLVKLLSRFFDIDSGKILVNGIDIKDLRLKYLRSKIVIVNQYTNVFDGSIVENITYGFNEIDQVLVDKLKKLLNTEDLDKDVSSLSEGQKRIISIFRALIYKPEVLILDEIFEAVDHKVITELFELMKDISIKIIITRQERVMELTDRQINMEDYNFSR